MKFILITLVKFYCWAISPLLGQSCRFHPTCSAYMVIALERHGVIKGLWFGLRRILKCQPYYKGDFLDDAPPVNSDSAKPRKVDCNS